MPPNKEIYERVTEKILKSLESGVMPWRKTWDDSKAPYMPFPRNAISRRPYSGVNVLALWSQPYSIQAWLTFAQGKAGNLKLTKGSKGTEVVFMSKVQKTDKDTGETKNIFIARLFYVFNIEQFADSPEREKIIDRFRNPKVNPIATVEELEEIVRATGAMVGFHSKACYWPQLDRIGMPNIEQFGNAAEYYATLFHELAHWTGHKTRLDRFEKSSSYAYEELVAELSAAFLCAGNGIEQATEENSASYIGSWIKALKDDVSFVVKAASEASKAASFIQPEDQEELEEAA